MSPPRTSVCISDPVSVAAAIARLPGAGFIVKPMVVHIVSASFLVKPMAFQRIRLPDLEHQCFFYDFGCPIYTTIAFLTISVARSIQPLLF